MNYVEPKDAIRSVYKCTYLQYVKHKYIRKEKSHLHNLR
jgi:hypothetical protein